MSFRTCLGCKKVCKKAELVRLAVVENRIIVDAKGRLAGRGAHVHAKPSCLAKAMNEKLLRFRLRFDRKASSCENRVELDMSDLKRFAAEVITSA